MMKNTHSTEMEKEKSRGKRFIVFFLAYVMGQQQIKYLPSSAKSKIKNCFRCREFTINIQQIIVIKVCGKKGFILRSHVKLSEEKKEHFKYFSPT